MCAIGAREVAAMFAGFLREAGFAVDVRPSGEPRVVLIRVWAREQRGFHDALVALVRRRDRPLRLVSENSDDPWLALTVMEALADEFRLAYKVPKGTYRRHGLTGGHDRSPDTVDRLLVWLQDVEYRARQAQLGDTVKWLRSQARNAESQGFLSQAVCARIQEVERRLGRRNDKGGAE